MLVQTLYIYLTNTLWTPHHISWIDSFVCWNHDKFLHTIFVCKISKYLCSINIILDTLARIVFHHGYMFICSSMEYIFRLIFLEHFFHSILFSDGCDNGMSFYVWPVLLHHQSDVMLWGFRLINKNHLRWIVRSNLSDHLTSNTACRSSDENSLACKHLTNFLHIHFDFIARKQFIDTYLS